MASHTYYELLKYLKGLFESNDQVSTVTTDAFPDMDNFKKNVYPIVDIFIGTSPFVEVTTGVTRFLVDIVVLDVRDVNNEDVNDKFWLNDNRHDNFNTTRAILKTAEAKSRKDPDNDLQLLLASDATQITADLNNKLDGWRQEWTIDVPDNFTTICDD